MGSTVSNLKEYVYVKCKFQFPEVHIYDNFFLCGIFCTRGGVAVSAPSYCPAPYFSHVQPTFLIEGLLESKNLFSKKIIRHQLYPTAVAGRSALGWQFFHQKTAAASLPRQNQIQQTCHTPHKAVESGATKQLNNLSYYQYFSEGTNLRACIG